MSPLSDPKIRDKKMDLKERILKEFKSYIVGVVETEERDAVYEKFKGFYNPEIKKFLSYLGFDLYKHQKDALELLYSGKNVIVTTPTASGKSEVFRLFILDNFLKNPIGTYLLIFPTRALLYDQYEKLLNRVNKLEKFLGKKLNIKILYVLGDQTYKEKEKVLDTIPNVILTTIDNLHLFLLKNHDKAYMFLKNLKLVVVDEIHNYRGVFGTNAAYVFRRLFRLLKYFYKNRKFRILALSATLKNAKEFCEELFGEPFEEIQKDFSRRYKKYIIAIDPKTINSRTFLRRILKILLETETKSLVFLESKKGVELSKISVMDIDKEERIHPYKASFTKEKRKKIETKFKEGDYLILVTTSALELGIDIGDIKAVVNYGIPKDGMFSLIQRFGRAGRKSEGYNIVIFRKDALDFYYSINKKEFFEKILKNKVDAIPVNLDNSVVAKRHLLYHIKEFRRLPLEILSKKELELVRELEKEKNVKITTDHFFNKKYAILVSDINYSGLRNISDKIYYITLSNQNVKRVVNRIKNVSKAMRFVSLLKSKGIILEEIDEQSFYEYLLPGMVYYSAGKVYRVEEFTTIGNVTLVFVRPEYSRELETYAISHEKVKILEKKLCKDFKDWKIYLGTIKVKKIYVGYLEKYKVEKYTRQSIHYYDTPIEREFVTNSVWITIPKDYKEIEREYYEYFKRKLEIYINRKGYKINSEDLISISSSIDREFIYEKYRGFTTKKIYEILEYYISKLVGNTDKKLAFLVKKLIDSYYSFQSGLHAIEHSIIKISPTVTNIDSRELGGYSYSIYSDTDLPTIFIYESYEGGAGLVEILYKNIEKLIERSKDVIFRCKCEDGCPRCILSTKCGNFNEFLDKYAARFIYSRVFSKH